MERIPRAIERTRVRNFGDIRDAVSDYNFLVDWYENPAAQEFLRAFSVRLSLFLKWEENDMVLDTRTITGETQSSDGHTTSRAQSRNLHADYGN